MKVIQVAESSRNEWDKFVQTVSGHTAYHRYLWRTIIEKSFGHAGHYLVAVDNDGEWCGVLPLIHMKSRLFGSFLVSVPFVNYGGVVAAFPEAVAVLLAEAERLRQRCCASHVELRHVGSGLDGLPTRRHKVTMILELAGTVDEQWKLFNAKLRNQIRKPEKSGLVPEIGRLELLDGFYDVFARNMRDLGTPVYAKDFFRTVLSELSGSSAIVAVRYQGKIVAAGIAVWHGDAIEVPWASSIADYKQFCPNNMLYWEAIKFAIGKGLHKFDFGRSTPDEGTYNFKKQWGAEPVPLSWQYLLPAGEKLPELNPKNPKYEMAIKVWQRLPVGVTRLIGPPIVRNIP